MSTHYTHNYIKHPPHKITVDVVGMGGTGCQVLPQLARINESLMGLDHPGLHVRAWDADIVTPANKGRQLYSDSDLGMNKATVQILRLNRFFGYEWEDMAREYVGKERSNILITCVDTARARIKIWEQLQKKVKNSQPTDINYYWLDIGNLKTTGQCVLGTSIPSQPPSSDRRGKKVLKNVIQKFPQIKRIIEEDQGPSCSMVEALEKQDLFINSTLAQFGCQLIWKLIRQGSIRYHGCYVNLETCNVTPIKIN